MTSHPPFAGVLSLEPRWWGWKITARCGPDTRRRRIIGSWNRADRIGRLLIAQLLEQQRRRRALANGGA